MRLQETFSEHTRDLAIAKSPGLSYFDSTEDKLKNIRKQLESNSDREKLDAMKRLVAMISKGRPVPEYFPSVVKNVSTQNLEIRKLVYIYLLRYSSQEPDLALLSINTFQKDLTDPNPLIRAMALRVLSGIKVGMIGGIVVMGIRKCASDVSPYVRKAAAFAVPKCYSLDASHLPSLIQVLTTLLRDRSPLSLGATAVAFQAVCPTRLDLLHPHYRRLCRTLVDMDEWGQVEMTNLLIRYARSMLARPTIMKTLDKSGNETGEESVDVDPDLQLLIACSEPLLHSRNPAVVLAVTRVFYYLSPSPSSSSLSTIVQPLLRLLTVSKEVERVVLVYILVIARRAPRLFSAYYPRFLVRSDDIAQAKELKAKVLLTILNHENHQALLREFIDYANDTDDTLVGHSIRAIGRVARLEPDCTQQCLTALLNFIRSKHDVQVSTAVLVLKSLVQSQSQSKFPAFTIGTASNSIISTLAYRIDDIKHPQARACVIWLVGQYAADDSQKGEGDGLEGIARWAPDVLRKAVKGFVGESPLVKLQTLTLASKLLVLCPAHATLKMLAQYVFSLARYDMNFDVRDRARMLSALLGGVVPGLMKGAGEEGDVMEDRGGVVLRREQVRLVLFEGKEVGQEGDFAGVDDSTPIGTLSAITNRSSLSDTLLPDWLEQGTEPSLRDTEDDMPQAPAVPHISSSAARSVAASPVVLTPTGGASPAGSMPKTGGGRFVDLDDLEKFYAEDEEEEDDDGDENEEEEDNEEESGEEEEENGEEVGQAEEPGESAEEGAEDDEEEEGSETESEDGAGERSRLFTAGLEDSGQAHW
ncbi:hypothetical protein GLOTRDRAFT_62844 [Gloeophyllum trabeum ATCC 11539]|uniref:Clathrin/coatomer adaptor adaptin-like N-terminal domain-containing protein n=1 Tax=Gloeophyllum trabeum (strain ATCC 11539 / FP-39264 / Madison 617) TaxID=670483 RepID=S7RNE5_GLOTA|nr:uncharacterized protein GLOTRDRAFT_62844 [Gloeophyllum trabeum ATCC 11539]EPQ54294.1 hypothetical protein GLOTRDRAFT_62844 [Gloeophyllum trabeum ATCC 11539]